MKSFNVLDRHLNLKESYLLEASAGTGKTFSIENIYVRLLLEGHDPISLDQILVVTFTKAAATDLKERILKNIQKTLKNIQKGNLDSFPDFLKSFYETFENASYIAEERLKKALFTFDEAEILTIHGFCYKILASASLEADICFKGVSEESTISNNEILKVIRNYFRTGLKRDQFSTNQIKILLGRHQSNFETFENEVLNKLKSGNEFLSTDSFQDLFIQFKEKMKVFKWKMSEILSDYEVLSINYRKPSDKVETDQKIAFFASLFEKSEVQASDFDQLIKDGLLLLDVFDESQLKKKQQPIDPSKIYYPNLIKDLKSHLEPLLKQARSYEMILLRLLHGCQKLYMKYLIEEEKFSFDDLLKRTNEALKHEAFLKNVRSKYQTVIIDEFQDTDPLQWAIFKTLFYEHSNIYLVGDPKQSIYGFRHADIYTYVSAKDLIKEENQYSLDTNYRSHAPLVMALNALFKRAKDFIELPKLNKILPFKDVHYSENIEEHLFKDAHQSIHFMALDGDVLSQVETENDYYFPYILKQIYELRKEGFKLSDIAILVKNHKISQEIYKFFNDYGLKATLQKDFSLNESLILKRVIELLQAVISPRDESALKVALGGSLIGYTDLEIVSLDDPLNLEIVLEKFYALRRLLFRSGFVKFIEEFLKSVWKEKSVAETILSRKNGIQDFLDLEQLIELLADYESKNSSTPDGLILYLKSFESLDFDEDERLKKRNDISSDAIQIMTMHSSKGLEFKVVFAFGVIHKNPSPPLLVPLQKEEKTFLSPILDVQEALFQNHLKELDAEKLRLLYVTLTRAKYRLYIPATFYSKEKASKLGTRSCLDLFFKKLGIESKENFKEVLADLSLSSSISYQFIEKMEPFYFKNDEDLSLKMVPPKKIDLNFDQILMQSFTQLSKIKYRETLDQIQKPHDYDVEEKTVFNLPVGAKTGVLLHSLLESLPLEDMANIQNPSYFRSFVESYTLGTKYEDWSDVLCKILFHVVQTDFGTFQFKEIDPLKIYREKDFIFLQNETPHFMKGVIDFVFMHDHKYYFIDWKSHFLGDSLKDYEVQNLKKVMIEENYFLQAEIYREALFRFLKVTDERDFKDSFGGVYYVFLRGLDLTVKSSGIYKI